MTETPSSAATNAAIAARRPPIHRRLYNWVLHWADSKHAGWALFLIAFAESSFFPIPPDVLLIALVLGDPRKAFRFASICLAGSVLGGISGYIIGSGFWAATSSFFYQLPGLTPEAFDQMARRYDEYGLAIVFLAAFTPIPYKLITISAGVFQISFLPFILASMVGRGARFFLVALLLYKFGERIRPIIDKNFEKLALAFGVLLVGGFVAIKLLR
jgi:membrane protein YqaA with SNARE-associated domain